MEHVANKICWTKTSLKMVFIRLPAGSARSYSGLKGEGHNHLEFRPVPIAGVGSMHT